MNLESLIVTLRGKEVNQSELEQALKRVPNSTYYSRRGISVNQKVDIPDNFEELLNCYFSCDRAEKDRFLRSSFWFQNAHRAHIDSMSNAFASMINAVEVLMPA